MDENFGKIIKSLSSAIIDDFRGFINNNGERIEVPDDTFHALIAKSLFTPVGEDQEDTYMDMIPSDKYNPEDEVIQTEFSAEMLALCKKCLDDRELFVITHKFELDGQPAMKQKAMAEYLGVSRTLIGNLEKRALRKLRAQITRTRKKYQDSW